MKRFLCLLILLRATTPVWAQPQPVVADVPAVPAAPKSVTLDNGLLVTPVIVPRDDVRDMLDIKMWRFNIKPPAPGTWFQAQMELRTTGKTPDEMNAIGMGLSDETELTFGILPKGGSMFSNAEMWRIHFATRSLGGKTPDIPSDGDRINPIKDLEWTGGTEVTSGHAAKPLPNGDILLMQFRSGTKENPILTELVLVLTAKTPEPPKQ